MKCKRISTENTYGFPERKIQEWLNQNEDKDIKFVIPYLEKCGELMRADIIIFYEG